MQQEIRQTASDEISLRDIVDVLKRNYRLIVGGGGAGLLFSAAYILVVPNQYEASWQMQMAQVGNSNSEEPAALIQRLRMPTAYPVEVQQACGMPDGGEFGDYLGGALKVEVVKNVANAAGMKVRVPGPEQAKQCADAIVAMVVAQQRGLIEERLAGRPEQILFVEQMLQRDMQLFENLRRNENGSLKYLAKLERINSLNARLDALKEEVLMSTQHPAKVTVPIFVPNKPVSPNVRLLLIFGMSLGLMLGALYALGRDGWRKAA
jgi:LPS O-antigen subunit length determinant protein (WzzB/FepE family)